MLQQLCLLTCFCSAEDPEGAGDARWRRDAQSDGVLPAPMPCHSASCAHIFQASHVTTFAARQVCDRRSKTSSSRLQTSMWAFPSQPQSME
jgi:hypothetical protein